MLIRIFIATSLLLICCPLIIPQKIMSISWNDPSDSASPSPVMFDRELYHSLKSHPDFQYEDTIAGPQWSKHILNWLADKWSKAWKWLLDGKEPSGFFSFLIQFVKYLSLLVLLGVIIWVIVKMESSTSRIKRKQIKQDEGDVEGKLIAKGDFAKLIQQAVEGRDFALAIRYHYLYSLQLLADKGMIVWESQKTNADYLREIKDPEVQGSFREITKWYHYFWFGKRAIDNALFKKANLVFEQFKTVI